MATFHTHNATSRATALSIIKRKAYALSEIPWAYAKKGGVYRIVNTVTGTMYIGQTLSLYSRMTGHRSALRRGKHYITGLQKDWNQYGEEGFMWEVLAESYDSRELRTLEQQWIDAAHAEDPRYGYNSLSRRAPRGSLVDLYGTIPSLPGVYCICHTPTDTYFLGATNNLRTRVSTHFSDLQLHRHGNPGLQAAWDSAPYTGFEAQVLEVVEDDEQLFSRGLYWFDHYQATYPGKCSNLRLPLQRPRTFKEDVEHLYLEEGLTYSEIAERLMVSEDLALMTIHSMVPRDLWPQVRKDAVWEERHRMRSERAAAKLAEKQAALERFTQAWKARDGTWTEEVCVALAQAKKAGCTLQALGEIAGVTGERIRQVLLRFADPIAYREKISDPIRAYWLRKAASASKEGGVA